MLKANRERVAYEKKIRDPDDCYLDVMLREEELRKQGQPSRFGLLLGMRRVTREEILSATFEDEDEAELDTEEEPGSTKASQPTTRGGLDANHGR
jgi:hypothetical protein